ncbi:ELP5 [Scenedesmus sp. PABB004]|nr:ELP5 [Scenedesmus sp. PABB004]
MSQAADAAAHLSARGLTSHLAPMQQRDVVMLQSIKACKDAVIEAAQLYADEQDSAKLQGLRQQLLRLVEAQQQVAAHQGALASLAASYQPSLEKTDFAAALQQRTPAAGATGRPERDGDVEEFDAIAGDAGAGGGDALEEDDDAELVVVGGAEKNQKCPYTMRTLLDLEEPVEDQSASHLSSTQRAPPRAASARRPPPMDAAVRCLRDGRAEGGAAAVVLILDDATTVGGHAVFEQVLCDTAFAIDAGRAQASRLHAVALDTPPSALAAAGAHGVTDAFSDPAGWLADSEAAGEEQVAWTDLAALRALAASDAAGWAAATGAGDARGTCVAVAGLSMLLQRHDTMPVVQALLALREHPCVSSVLLSLHQDLHAPQALAALTSLASTTLALAPMGGLQELVAKAADKRPCHGRLTASTRRARVGRLRVEAQLFRLLPGGGVEAFAAPDGALLDARQLVETTLAAGQLAAVREAAAATAAAQRQQTPGGAAAAAAHGTAAAELAKQLGGSMRLDVSAQERAARAAVRLPYQHQGAGAAYAGGDARDYLPPAAGGHGPGAGAGGAGRLGHILYVRDSEGEADSDEDPDDDLDV